MRKPTAVWSAVLGLALLFLTSGCGSEDGEGLKNVCQKVREKGEDLTGGHHSKLATSLRALRGSASNAALDSRVSLRLRWDTNLEGADIQVSVTSPGVVKLEGTVTNQIQRGRALELARATKGVTGTEDSLTIKPIGD
jgi:osmotically-inducible protein OsmY